MRGLEHGVSCETPHGFGGFLGAEALGWRRFSTPGPALPSVCGWTMRASVVWPMGCSCCELCPGLQPTLPPNSGREGG